MIGNVDHQAAAARHGISGLAHLVEGSTDAEIDRSCRELADRHAAERKAEAEHTDWLGGLFKQRGDARARSTAALFASQTPDPPEDAAA